MFKKRQRISARPAPFECYTASDLWTDEHTSAQMLAFHLNDEVDISSRKGAFIERSVDWICDRFDIGPGTRIADFGCGPGLYATRLARRYASVTGIDFSPRSIHHAREVATQEGLSIHYVNQNYLEFDTDDRFHLVLMIMCDFCALGPAQRRTMLRKYNTILEPGGVVLLDVYSLKAFDKREEVAKCEPNLMNGFWSPDRYYGYLNTYKYEAEKVVLDKYTIVEATRTRTVYNWLQYFSPEALEREFEECGLAVEGLYGDVAGAPFDASSDEFAVVAGRQ